MRWRSPSEAVQLVLLSPLIIVAVPALLLFFGPPALIMLSAQKIREWCGIPTEWEPWFAWRPVYCEWNRGAPRWAWLETVERRFLGGWQYGFKEEK